MKRRVKRKKRTRMKNRLLLATSVETAVVRLGVDDGQLNDCADAPENPSCSSNIRMVALATSRWKKET